MREGLPRLGLALLSAALFLGPILVAFIHYNWDLAALVKPSPDLMVEFTPAMQPRLENFQFELISFEEPPAKELRVRVKADYSNPTRFPVRFGAASLAVRCSTHRDNLGQAWLENGVTVAPNSSASVAFVVDFTPAGFDHLEYLHTSRIGPVRWRVDLRLDVEGSVRVFIYEIQAEVPLALSGLSGSVEVP